MSSLGFTSKEQRNLGLLVHLMTSNPKILYAPVGTEVDKVILKVRAQSGCLSISMCQPCLMCLVRRALCDGRAEQEEAGSCQAVPVGWTGTSWLLGALQQ